MKLQTFDRNLIRGYMETSSVLEQGIRYCQHITPESSTDVAKEAAIRMAVEYCERIWYNDSTGYISNERIAFDRFVEDVKKQRYFYAKGMKTPEDLQREKEKEQEQASRWRKENTRVRELREYCRQNHLDFETENAKAVQTLKKNNNTCLILEWTAVLVFIAAIVLWLFTSIGNALIWIPVIIASIVVFIIGDKIDPKLPDDYFKLIKKGMYNFDR